MTGRASRIGLIVALGGYLAARLVVLIWGKTFVAYDTASYAPRGDAALDHGPVLSFIGNAPRLWGVPAFYALLGTDGVRIAGQWLVATAAWMALAVTIWTLVRQPAARLAAAVAVLVFALLGVVGNWDLALLSESLSISLGVLTLALLLRWLATGRPAVLAGATAAVFWWTFTRPDIRVFTVIMVVVLAVVAWRRRERRPGAVIAAAVLLVAIGWSTAIVPATTRAGVAWSGLGAQYSADEWLLYRLRVQVLPDPAIKAVFSERLGMPACPGAEAVATRVTWDIKDFADAYGACPQLRAWAEANRDSAFTEFARVAPAEYARMTIDLVNQSWHGGRYADVPSVLPPQLDKIVFPGRSWPLVLTLGGLLLAAAAVTFTRARRSHRLLVDGAWVLAGASIVSTAAAVLAGTGEFWRFGIQEAIGLRLALLMLGAAVLDSWLGRHEAQASDLPAIRGLRSIGIPWPKRTRVTNT